MNKRIKEIKKDGLTSFLVKRLQFLRFSILRNFYFNENDLEMWLSLKGKYKGQTAYLIGNGPSLNKTPLFLLKDKYTMCFNRFHLMNERLNWTPSFFMATDDLIITDLLNENENFAEKYDYSFFPNMLSRGDIFYKKISRNENIGWFKIFGGMNFSLEMPKVYTGGTVIYEGMQILNYLGFEKIYFIGVDMNYQVQKTATKIEKYTVGVQGTNDDDPNHFDPRYFGKGKSFHQPVDSVIMNIMNHLNYLGNNQKKYHTNIINAGYDSHVDSFPREDFMNTLNIDKCHIRFLFDDLVNSKTKYSCMTELKNNSKVISDEKELDKVVNYNFYTCTTIGLTLLKNVIFTHLPLGPYDNKYFFVLRNNVLR